MKITSLKEAIFLKRINRFVGEVLVEGENLLVHIRNTGRLTELLRAGRKVFLREKASGKYPFDIFLVKAENSLVCIDSTIAPKLYAEFLNLPVKFEPVFGNQRFDLMYSSTVVETKSVNLVEHGIALFPDAPTERGTKHIYKLIEIAKDGLNPELVFVVQREDAKAFSPNYGVDRKFSEAVKLFYQMGFPVKAFLCKTSLSEITIYKEIEVIFLEHG